MDSSHIIQGTGRADWTLVTAVHDALRRDLDQLLHTTASRAAAAARWRVLRDQLHHHLATEDALLWQPARSRLAGDPHGQALLDAMDDEHRLIGPLRALTDDAFAMDAGPRQLGRLLARLQTRLTSHLAHEEADALPLIGQIMTQRELGRFARAIRGGRSVRRTPVTVPWALAGAAPGVRDQVLRQLPAPTRLLYRTVWRPHHTRSTPQL